MSMSDMRSWLTSLSLEKYEEVLAQHDIDMTVVPDLTEQDLEKLGLSLGHRRKFLAAAARLRPTGASSAIQLPLPQPSDAPTHAVERRQLTVVFVDLVGSTALSGRLDPEDLIHLLRQYRDACVASIAKYEGFIAQYLGDGVLAYFGFPQAQEDAAERAVRAGLEIVEKVRQLKQPDGQPLQARVGIVTGLAVTGGVAGVGPAGEETVVGDTPNLAARLQSLADPGCVFVGPLTHRLTADFFEFSLVGEHVIKGFREPISVWKALRESATESRFAAAHAATAGPIFGRNGELAFLYDSWQRATQGNGQAALLVGEPGIGKSRLLEALAERVRKEPHHLLRGQCSPYHRNSVLFPFKQLLRHRLDLNRDLPQRESLDRIERTLAMVGRRTRSSALLVAELLGVPVEETLSPLEMTPNQRKNETLSILEDLLLAAESGPVLLMLEDAHWSDQTTQTLVERLLERVGREQALVLITYRPELKTSWHERSGVDLISCKPIGHEHCAALIRQIAEGQIGDDLIREVAKRSDGVPLFAEELTKAVLDLRSSDPGAVPLTLQDSLMARLDRLGRAKDIAQIASVIGRQFSYEMLEAIAGASSDELRSALAQLRASGLVLGAGTGDKSSSYSFKHSLVQEAAYESLSRSRRQSLHKEIAAHLESGADATGGNEPTLIAYHYSRAGEAEKSCHFWLVAAERSSRDLGFADSLASLGSALTEADRVGDPEIRTRLKVDAQLKLGTTLALHKGPQSSEAESALEQAWLLAKEANAGPQMFQATWGLYLNAARNQRLDKAKIRGEELLRISQAVGDEDLKFEALHHRWGLAYFLGQTEKMLEFTNEGISRYDRERHHKLTYVFAGHDPGACAYCVKAMALGLAGRARGARPALDAGLALAHSLQHPLTLAFYHSVACTATHIAGDADGCREFAERLIQVSTRYDFPAIAAVGSFMRGASDALQNEPVTALRQMEPSFEGAFAYGFLGVYPGLVMAQTLVAADRREEALTLVTRLLDKLSTPEEGTFVSELWRLRGELVLRRSADNSPDAERYQAKAVRIAREQGAVVFHLRATVSLARQLAAERRREEAKIALKDVILDRPVEWEGRELAAADKLWSELK
jgi:class 3 adenylate cyclase